MSRSADRPRADAARRIPAPRRLPPHWRFVALVLWMAAVAAFFMTIGNALGA